MRVIFFRILSDVKGIGSQDIIQINEQKWIFLGISTDFWIFEMLLWWDVVIDISHAVKVKTYGRNNIYWRDIY